jgi:hypothetical protein
VSQDETPAAVSVQIPLDQVEQVFEALEKAERKPDLPGGSREQQDFFAQQNPATQKMADVVTKTYDAMTQSMLSEIAEVLK